MVAFTTTMHALVALGVVVGPTLTAGHGLMVAPKATFKGGDPTVYATRIESGKLGWSGKFNGNPDENAAAFTAAFKTSEYKTLRDLIKAQAKEAGECGNTELKEPQPLPDKVEWNHGPNEGFTQSHSGPCEVWCDDTRAFQNDNCAKNYPSAPALLDYDKSKCAGAKKLTLYWLALHEPNWQVYVNCAAVAGGNGPAPSSGAPSPSSGAPSPSSGSPSPSNSPSGSPKPAPGKDEDCDEYPEPDADCDEYPEPDADCDDLPEPDCDEYPEPDTGKDDDPVQRNINFEKYKSLRGGEDAPGQVSPDNY